MNYSWKLYRKRISESPEESKNESLFIVGLDMGSNASAIAYYDTARNVPEVIDVSGGYGKPSMPTALQYVRESREWVFGEYALLNRGVAPDTMFLSFLDKLSKKEYLDVDGKPTPAETLAGIYLKELIGNCRNINPKAEIAGITLAVPSYANQEALDALRSALKQAGYEKSLISMDADRECVFSYYFHNRPVKEETVVLLDFGARELRGGIYGINPGRDGEPAVITTVSSLFDKALGSDVVDRHISGFLSDFYCLETKTAPEKLDPRTAAQIEAFAYQHKDLLFQQNLAGKPVKLYYNFVYPPIVKTVDATELAAFIKPYREKFTAFLDRLYAKAIAETAAKNGVVVICAGGGFEMMWARNTVGEFFTGSEVMLTKNPKNIVGMGAAIRSAQALGAVHNSAPFVIDDSHKLRVDVGVSVRVKADGGPRDKFHPIVERNSFWWQAHDPVSFICNRAFPAASGIEILSRDGEGEVKPLGTVTLDGLPDRPAGVTRLNVRLEFTSYNVFTVTVRDMGFGEMFPRTDYNKKVELRI